MGSNILGIRCSAFAVLFFCLVAVAGCAKNTSARGGDTTSKEGNNAPPTTRILTPELAKQALLEMLRSEHNELWDENRLEKMSKMEITKEADGWYAWTGAFKFNPAKAHYTLTIRPAPDARACTFEYDGSFVNNDNRWVASSPHLVGTALQPGE
jgi:hypothetical protein